MYWVAGDIGSEGAFKVAGAGVFWYKVALRLARVPYGVLIRADQRSNFRF